MKYRYLFLYFIKIFKLLFSFFNIHLLLPIVKFKLLNLLRKNKLPLINMYNFRPFELTEVDYKTYRGLYGEGIHTYPKPRSGHRIVCSDNDLFCFGGFNPDLRIGPPRANLFQELWKYNILTRKWCVVLNSKTKNMPDELASSAIAFKNNVLIIFGGTGYPFGNACSNKSYLYLPYRYRNAITRLKTTGEKPLPQYGQAVIFHDKYLYVVGGTTGFDYSCDIFRLNVISKRWDCIYVGREDIRDDPKGRYRHGIAYDEKFIYILGGGNSQTAYDLEIVPAFDVEANSWKFLKTKGDPHAKPLGFPECRKCHSCIQYKTDYGLEVVIAGGYYKDNTFFNDIWKLNLTTLQWQLFQTARFPRPIYFHDAATSGNGLMYVFGGIEATPEQSVRTNRMYQMWVKIPKLSEICWNAMLHYQPKIPTYSVDKLLEVGVPLEYAKRVNFR